MHIPLAYADAVIGAAGASISYIRRHSGATVTIQESRGAPGEMTVEIIGTAAQVQTAEQLIQVPFSAVRCTCHKFCQLIRIVLFSSRICSRDANLTFYFDDCQLIRIAS